MHTKVSVLAIKSYSMNVTLERRQPKMGSCWDAGVLLLGADVPAGFWCWVLVLVVLLLLLLLQLVDLMLLWVLRLY